jgi:hypothetical protein
MLAKRGLLCGVILVALNAAPALTVENFIPQGHTYGPDQEILPPLNSTEDRINLGADLLQSEIYVQQRQRQLFNSDLNRFINDQHPDPTDNSLDY